MRTIKELYVYAKGDAWSDNQTISISASTLAVVVAYAESIGVRAGHDQYSAAIKSSRAKAKTMRYRHMAEAVLPESDYLYDSRYADTTEYADWEVAQ